MVGMHYHQEFTVLTVKRHPSCIVLFSPAQNCGGTLYKIVEAIL